MASMHQKREGEKGCPSDTSTACSTQKDVGSNAGMDSDRVFEQGGPKMLATNFLS